MKNNKQIIYIGVILAALMAIVILSCSKDKEYKDGVSTYDSEYTHLESDDGEQCFNIPEITRENIDEMICFYYNEYTQTLSKSNGPGFFERVWQWLVAHAGRSELTYLGEHCSYNNPCGPCPGICLHTKDGEVFSKVSDDYLLSKDEYDDGLRLFQAALFNDSIMGLSFMQSCFVAADGNFYVPEDFSIGAQAATAFGKNEIIILQGTYPVSSVYTQNGTTLVKVQTY